MFSRKLSTGFTIGRINRILKKIDILTSFKGIKNFENVVYAYKIVENTIPPWVSPGFVVCGEKAKQSIQVQEREGKVNPVKKKNLDIISQYQNIKKLVYPYDINASNEPKWVFGGVDMGGVDAGWTSGVLEVPEFQHPGQPNSLQICQFLSRK